MRLEPGAGIRAFNGRDGEFTGTLSTLDKKQAVLTLQSRIRQQPQENRRIHLLFAPIRKERMDWLVEKSVELGATDLHPVLTQNTDNRKVNEERMRAQIIEAAEQCERLDIPTLHAADDLFKILTGWNPEIPVLAAVERVDAPLLSASLPKSELAILIGPSGGFTREEKDQLGRLKCVRPVSLGQTILRSETAAIAALAVLAL